MQEEYTSAELKQYIQNVGLSSIEALQIVFENSLYMYGNAEFFTPITIALTTLFQPSEAFPYYMLIEDDKTLICCYWIRDVDFWHMLNRFMSLDDAYERLDRIVNKNRQGSKDVDYMLQLVKQSGADLVFRFCSSSYRNIDVPIPNTNKKNIPSLNGMDVFKNK